MGRLAFVLLYALLATLLAASYTPRRSPRLRFRYKDGRVFVEGVRRRTISAAWDRKAQDVVASLPASSIGPTLASAAYVKMHTAIYETWVVYKKHGGPPMAREVAMHFAAYHSLVRSLPGRRSMIKKQLRMALRRVGTGPRARVIARRIGVSKAVAVHKRYDRFVLPPIARFPFRSSIEKWTPERVPIDNPTNPLQTFTTTDWGRRFTFGVPNGAYASPPPPEPVLLVKGVLNKYKATITLDSGRTLKVARSLIGTVINPRFIKQAQVVLDNSAALTDRKKMIAEFWEAGPGTSYPTGIWGIFAQWVSAHNSHSDDDDVALYFALSNALYDAGVMAWHAKWRFNYARPVRAIRDLAKLGLIGKFDARRRTQLIRAYDLRNRRVHYFPAERFETYQQRYVGASPPFAEYVSGHSAFSAAGAEVLRRWTGSDRFGAGVVLPALSSRFERGYTPKAPVVLRWRTFSAAADEAGISRLYGGIHFTDGNENGALIGQLAGTEAYKKAQRIFRKWRY